MPKIQTSRFCSKKKKKGNFSFFYKFMHFQLLHLFSIHPVFSMGIAQQVKVLVTFLLDISNSWQADSPLFFNSISNSEQFEVLQNFDNDIFLSILISCTL